MSGKKGHGDQLVNNDASASAVTTPLVIGVAVAVIGASFQYGYNIAVVNAPADEIKSQFFPYPPELSNCYKNDSNSSAIKKSCDQHKEYQDNLYAIAVSAFAAAGMIGSLLVGPIVNKFGRLGGLMVNNLLSFIAAIFLGAAKPANSFVMLVIGRIFIGIFAGLATGVVPMYISEISPRNLRGSIGVLNQLLITIGILVAQIFGMSNIMGTDELWPYLLAFTCVPSAISLICYPAMTRSPRYLLIDRKNPQAARKALVKLRGTSEVEEEMEEMKNEAAEQKAAGQMTIPQLFRERSIRWQLITILLMMVAQQLSGINAVFFYTNKIFESAGIKNPDDQNVASVVIGAVNVFMTIVSVVVIDRAGRKKLIVGGFGFMILWCLLLTIILNLLISHPEWTWVSYASIGCVIGYIVGFAIGPGPIPWLINAELFRQAARPAATMVSCLVNWTCNFIIGISFPAVANLTGPYVFIVFMFVCIAITAYLFIFLPETKNKTFQEINQLFAKRNGITVREDDFENSQKVPLQSMGSRQEAEA